MRLIQFIEGNVEAILVEWEALARRFIAPSTCDSSEALRDHIAQILMATVRHTAARRAPAGRDGEGEGPPPATDWSYAASHGAMRYLMGFSPVQLVSEFGALRATVLGLFERHASPLDLEQLREATHFNVGLDQAVAESSRSYAAKSAESRDTFLAVLAHDLRSPLGSLRNCLHLLGKPDFEKLAKEKVVGISLRSVASMDEMIEQLIDLTRRSLGRGFDVRPRRGNLGSLCESAVEEVRAAHPGVQLNYDQVGDLSSSFDSFRMRQVLINLLTNAIKHGDVKAGVVVAARGEPQGVVLSVTNQGTPIPAEFLAAIFDPMVSYASTASRAATDSTSLGLGLYIAREIVVAHAGSIEVSSTAREGTTFSVHLPRGTDFSASTLEARLAYDR